MDFDMETPSTKTLKKIKRRSHPVTLMDRVLQTPLKRRSSYPSVLNARNDTIGRISKPRNLGTRSLMDRTLAQRRVVSSPITQARLGLSYDTDTDEDPCLSPGRRQIKPETEDESMLVDSYPESDIELDLHKLHIRSPPKSHVCRCTLRTCSWREQVDHLEHELDVERHARRKAQQVQLLEYRRRLEVERVLESLQSAGRGSI